MASVISEILDSVLDDVSMSSEHYANMCDARDQVLELQKQIKEKEKDVLACINKLCAELAAEVREISPSIAVTMKNNICTLNYKTKSVNCIAHPYDGRWDFSSTEFGNRFSKMNPSCSDMSCSISELAQALANHFRLHFVSLRSK